MSAGAAGASPAAAGDASSAPAAGLTAGSLMRRTLSIWGRNLPAITVVSALVHVPYAAFWLLPALGVSLDALDNRVLDLAVRAGFATLMEAVASGVLAAGVGAELRGGRMRLGVLLDDLARRGPALVPVALLRALAVLGGLAVVVVPGILLRLALCVAAPVVALERRGPFAALGRSVALTRNHLGAIFGALFVLGLIERFASGAADHLLVPVSAESPWLGWAMAHLAAAFASAPVAIACAVAYHELRAVKEGGGGAELEKVFE